MPLEWSVEGLNRGKDAVVVVVKAVGPRKRSITVILLCRK